MSRAGITLYPEAAQEAAFRVCIEVWTGTHPEYVAAEVAAVNPNWYFEQAEAFVAASIAIYCPPDSLKKTRT